MSLSHFRCEYQNTRIISSYRHGLRDRSVEENRMVSFLNSSMQEHMLLTALLEKLKRRQQERSSV